MSHTHPGSGGDVPRSGEIPHRPCTEQLSLRVLVGPGEGDEDFDVPARKVEFVLGLEHCRCRSVGEIVVVGGGEGGG